MSLPISEVAVFLDRDGTINIDTGYIGVAEGFTLITGAAVAIRLLNQTGVKVFIVTNQSGIGRGYFTETDLGLVNARMKELLSLEGARIDGIYYCTHRPDDNCDCRKPATALVKRAEAEHAVKAKSSFVVGDKFVDVALGKNVGAKSVLVLTGAGEKEREKFDHSTEGIIPDLIAKDLLGAAEWIVREIKNC
ncbi:MAG: HAD family hydrolase [Deltaproteobacteria bacterium]|nr:HAD family hydrolase [Deltaproteobacteria bacterium]